MPEVESVAKRARVKDREFVEACLTGVNLEDTATLLGMKKSGVSARARRLRKAGVKVPRFKPGMRAPRKPEVDELNALIASKG